MPKVSNDSITLPQNNKNYHQYRLEREELLKNYPIPEGETSKKWDRKKWRERLSAIADLLFEPNGSYQKWVWESEPAHIGIIKERQINGRKRRGVAI